MRCVAKAGPGSERGPRLRESMASVLLSGIEARSGPGKDFPFLDVPWPEKISERTLDSLFDAAETCAGLQIRG